MNPLAYFGMEQQIICITLYLLRNLIFRKSIEVNRSPEENVLTNGNLTFNRN